MKSSAKNIQLTSFDDIFKTDEEKFDTSQERVQEIRLTELFSFNNHPFHVTDDDEMQKMVESIQKYGVLNPAIARPRTEGGYELISGHRRKHGSELAGKETMPVIVRELDDDAATIIMVDSNLQRESLLPSERAYAYKMKLEAMKRQTGRPAKDNVSQLGTQKRSDQLLAEQTGESRNQIQRYVRLVELNPNLLQMVDDKKLAFNPAVELSYLKKEEQAHLLDIIEREDCTPSIKQAQRLKSFSQTGILDLSAMKTIMTEEKSEPAKFTIPANKLKKYFPSEFTQTQMEIIIIKLLEDYKKKNTSDN